MDCHYAKCCGFIVIQSVVILNVIMLSVVAPSVSTIIILTVMASIKIVFFN
jgi:hypothetical protein